MIIIIHFLKYIPKMIGKYKVENKKSLKHIDLYYTIKCM